MKERHIIAAVCDGGGIGYKGGLIMKLKADMQHFKDHTLGNIVIMGRKTFESIGSTPLKCRNNIVVTSKGITISEADAECLFQVATLQEAFDLAETLDGDKVYVIGGAQLYKEAIDHVDILDITEINFLPNKVDTYFPEYDVSKWSIFKRSERYFTDKIPPYRFVTYKRIN